MSLGAWIFLSIVVLVVGVIASPLIYLTFFMKKGKKFIKAFEDELNKE